MFIENYVEVMLFKTYQSRDFKKIRTREEQWRLAAVFNERTLMIQFTVIWQQVIKTVSYNLCS